VGGTVLYLAALTRDWVEYTDADSVAAIGDTHDAARLIAHADDVTASRIDAAATRKWRVARVEVQQNTGRGPGRVAGRDAATLRWNRCPGHRVSRIEAG